MQDPAASTRSARSSTTSRSALVTRASRGIRSPAAIQHQVQYLFLVGFYHQHVVLLLNVWIGGRQNCPLEVIELYIFTLVCLLFHNECFVEEWSLCFVSISMIEPVRMWPKLFDISGFPFHHWTRYSMLNITLHHSLFTTKYWQKDCFFRELFKLLWFVWYFFSSSF